MKRLWMFLPLLAIVSSAWAGEQIDLTVPDQATPGTPTYYIAAITMDRDAVRVDIRLGSSIGLMKTLTFTGAEAASYIRTANKKDFTTVSMQKWTLGLLIAKGWLAGTISGVPE